MATYKNVQSFFSQTLGSENLGFSYCISHLNAKKESLRGHTMSFLKLAHFQEMVRTAPRIGKLSGKWIAKAQWLSIKKLSSLAVSRCWCFSLSSFVYLTRCWLELSFASGLPCPTNQCFMQKLLAVRFRMRQFAREINRTYSMNNLIWILVAFVGKPINLIIHRKSQLFHQFILFFL